MKIATGFSTKKESEAAVTEAIQMLPNNLQPNPTLLIVYSTVNYNTDSVREHLSNIAIDSKIHGGTSCLGVMTHHGFHSNEGVGLGVLGIYDDDGDFGTGLKSLESGPRKAGAEAATEAISIAGRLGEPPALIWLNSAPGTEEQVLLGVQDVVGKSVPIAGGSTADNTIEGNWKQFSAEKSISDGVVVTVMYPSTETCMSFHNGYSPTANKGIVTKVEGRTLFEIDGKPAAEVYNKWTDGTVSEYLDGGNVLGATTLFPLGRVVGKLRDIEYHNLSHPETITEDGAMTLFSNLDKGDEIFLMTGTKESLVTRAGIVAKAAIEKGEMTKDDICGGLIVYCAGCMLAVQDQMGRVASEIMQEIDAPFLGLFSFGEQGKFYSGENSHGNLMISMVLFKKQG